MATVKEHYEQLLSEHYAWMFGGLDNGIDKNLDFFKTHHIIPHRSGVAIDLGAGCGFQSIPLARLGFSVLAIDLNSTLLDELENNSSEKQAIRIIQDDLINFDTYTKTTVELIVCMTDTLLHLETPAKVQSLFKKVFASLEEGGQFIITFRDLSYELTSVDRFIPVRSDENTIFTCFLEYEPESVKVHDIIYTKEQGKWTLNKSFYKKLRLSKTWVDEQLSNVGFNDIASTVENGVVSVIAVK
ncbi:MAG: class I SAM-dependent methyltransferase [Candidatus Parabeggiatoa sp.]|nr:class I SAM-dependent methyltransferase [Candidatus Parabeggiatoa sp.]